MKKTEIKKFEPKSAFRAVLMSVAIPYIFFLSVFIVAGILSGKSDSLVRLGPMIITPVIYALVAMLLVASYNWLAPKYGGGDYCNR